MTSLPDIMVAPNGARHSKADHPGLPITLDEITQTARACFAAGAGGIHLHLRDKNGQHVLDHGLYREALKELNSAVPQMAVQITTEAATVYLPKHQMRVALQSGATLVSASIRELTKDQNPEQVSRFYQTAADLGIHIQHIIYDLSDLRMLKTVLPEQLFELRALQLLFVLGQYGHRDSSDPRMLDGYLRQMEMDNIIPDWAVCAFGHSETRCLTYARQKGGKIRVGFENSFWNADKSVAKDNAERVRCCVGAVDDQKGPSGRAGKDKDR